MNTPLPHPSLDALVTLKVWNLAVVFEQRLAAELSSFGLSVAAFRLIGVVMMEPGGLRQGEIARRLGVRAPTVSAAVARLEKDGLIVRSPDPDDPRARLVSLAPNAPLKPGFDVLRQMEALLTEGLNSEEVRATEEMVERLSKSLETGPEASE